MRFCQSETSGCSYFFELSDDIRGSPVVVGIPGCDLTVFSYQNGRQGVVEGLTVAGGNAYVEELGNSGEILFGRGSEVPMLEGLPGGAAKIVTGVGAEDGGGIVGGIEADAEEVGPGVEAGVGSERLVDVGEVTGHARAELVHSAAGVDEGDEQYLALKLA